MCKKGNVKKVHCIAFSRKENVKKNFSRTDRDGVT
jgi:enoyl-[acyl-carrier-protein] reductase (NADH)